jgi:hypothetical protein
MAKSESMPKREFQRSGSFGDVRKCIAIGAIAAVVIGFAGYVASLAKQGSVDWHKRDYLRADKAISQWGVGDSTWN